MKKTKLNPVITELVNKTLYELSHPKPQREDSRVWQDPEGYRYLFPWSNAVLLRYLIRLLTSSFPKSEYRRKAQLDDAGRSVVRNIEEGYKRATTEEYIEFIGFSQGSLEEVKGDIRELTEDKFLKSFPNASLVKLGINLRDFNFSLRKPRQRLAATLKENSKGNVRGDFRGTLEENKGLPLPSSNLPPNSSFNRSPNSSSNPSFNSSFNLSYQDITFLYPPLKKICPKNLSYEIFLELINKTGFLLAGLVISLENKLNSDKKYYQVERLRLNFRKKN